MSLDADRRVSKKPLEVLTRGLDSDPCGPSFGPRRSETLKIIVVGTPKTGNTWVKHLLADVYDLPLVELKPEFDQAEAEAAGPRWVGHQHYLPKQRLLDWGAANNVAFVSVVRHPGDVLISLWHHMRQRRSQKSPDFGSLTQDASILSQGSKVAGEHTETFVERSFHLYLNISITWLDQPGTVTVRYEDLWNRPVTALTDLTDSILPMPSARLQLALCGCELGLMQSLLDPEKTLIRQGGVGGWRVALSPRLKNALITLDPYPAQFEALGYTMDERNPANAVRPVPGRVVGPFGETRSFANGTPITPVLMKAYFDLAPDRRDRWLDPRAVSADSFFNWLNRPAAADPAGGKVTPVMTELAHYIYRVRSDLQAAFPDPFGVQRSDFYDWFLFNARQEYGLPNCFVSQNPFSDAEKFSDGTPNARVLVRAYLSLPEEMRRRWPDPAVAGDGSFLAWLNSPAMADPPAENLAPAVTELGAYLHSIRPDVRGLMPDLFGVHRVDFANWFIASASREYQLDRVFALPVIRSWAERVRRVPAQLSQPSGRRSPVSA